MHNRVIFGSIIPAIRLFTGDKHILFKHTADDFPTAERVEFYPSAGGGTAISLQTGLGTELKSAIAEMDYKRFEEYAQMIDKLPIMGDKIDHPIYRVNVTIKVDSVIIDLLDYNPNENISRFTDK